MVIHETAWNGKSNLDLFRSLVKHIDPNLPFSVNLFIEKKISARKVIIVILLENLKDLFNIHILLQTRAQEDAAPPPPRRV